MTADIRICFVGDSFVNGTGDETALGWTGRLCAAANRMAGVTYYNLGIRRDTSRDILERWERECSLRLPDFCDGRIVLSCGVNDAVIENGQLRVPPEQSAANIAEILNQARRYRTLMVGPPPLGEPGIDRRIEQISNAFAKQSAAMGVPFIGLYSELAHDQAYLREVQNNDGAHPQSSGYARIAGIIAASPAWWFHE